MSRRYEWVDAAAFIELVAATDTDHPVWEEGDEASDQMALVIGDPYASALVVAAPLAGLREFAQRICELLDAASTDEQ